MQIVAVCQLNIKEFLILSYLTCLYLVKHSPDGASTDSDSSGLISAYYSCIDPREDDRLSWPSLLTQSGWFTHINGYPSAAGPV